MRKALLVGLFLGAAGLGSTLVFGSGGAGPSTVFQTLATFNNGLTVSGPLTATGATFSGNVAVAGTLGVTGAFTARGATTFNAAVSMNSMTMQSGLGINVVDNTALGSFIASPDTYLLQFATTNGSEATTSAGRLIVDTSVTSGRGGDSVLQLNNTGTGTALLDFNPSSAAKILLPNTATCMSMENRATGAVYFGMNCTAKTIVHNQPLWGATGTVAAAGNSQSTVTAIPVGSVMVSVSGCDGTKGAALPSGSTATAVRIMSQSSTSTNTCKIFPNNNENDTINGAAADAVYTQAAGVSLLYQTDDGTNWTTY